MSTMKITHAGYSAPKVKLISGRTLELGVPKSKLVRIFSRGNGALLKQIKSDSNGYYKAYLPYDAAYLIVGIDENKIFNATAQDNVGAK
ncbi:hypothetical protein [Acinetobacter towneri]|uniref:hypothetical protein n=1 Tax=Acinetobacter towneri TaxID=202956 RepID=UPI0002CFABE2|nr:hypothetical protein [Acinetobacter towneri]ENV69793.1 hypothetical protein F947_01470 [Acinetobacter towneri DSM 14962 = CIP 107472]